ncbi:MAG: response regulator [Planctomycetes bacterium]|nr:response regulator [Planctomycetota bacterium]
MQIFMPQPTVLVVDDEEPNREILRDLLKDDGYFVLTAANGSEALQLLSDEVGLVIMDMCMPVLNGVDTCAEMNRNPKTRSIPVLFLSGCNRDSQLRPALNAGALDFVEKPIQCADLRAKVSAAFMLTRIENPALRRRLYQELVLSEAERLRQEDVEPECCFEARCAL